MEHWPSTSRVISSFRSRAAWEGVHALALLDELDISDNLDGTLGNIGTDIGTDTCEGWVCDCQEGWVYDWLLVGYLGGS